MEVTRVHLRESEVGSQRVETDLSHAPPEEKAPAHIYPLLNIRNIVKGFHFPTGELRVCGKQDHVGSAACRNTYFLSKVVFIWHLMKLHWSLLLAFSPLSGSQDFTEMQSETTEEGCVSGSPKHSLPPRLGTLTFKAVSDVSARILNLFGQNCQNFI